MTRFISFDLLNLPMPLQQVSKVPATAIPVELIPQGPLVKVEKSRTPSIRQPAPQVSSPSTFEAYNSNLPSAEKQLITHLHEHITDERLLDCLIQGAPLCFCTNGGALKHVGSIGWVIATDDEVLWECLGSAFGWYGNQFRSEGLSHLSLFVFLRAFITFYRPTVYQPPSIVETVRPQQRPWIRAAMDNQGLIKRLAQALQRSSYPFPSDALRAEYDVIISITSIVQSLPLPIQWEHVKGHQDAVVPKDELTCMEQLNILADALATQELTRATARRLSPCLPESIVELQVQSTTITSHYATYLRKAAGSEDVFRWFRTN
jgi:hypothetical protein